MTRSERAAASVKGSIYQKSNSKSGRQGAESEKCLSLGIKVTSQESASETDLIGKLPNISERVAKKVDKRKSERLKDQNRFKTPSESLKGSHVNSALYLKKKNGTDMQSQKNLPTLHMNLVEKFKESNI